MTNRLTPEALDALLAEHVVCPNPECPFLNQEHCPACGPLVPWPCPIYLLASEVRDARPVIDGVRKLEQERERPEFREQRLWANLDNMGHCHKNPPNWDDSGRGICGRCEAWMEVRRALAHYEEGTK